MNIARIIKGSAISGLRASQHKEIDIVPKARVRINVITNAAIWVNSPRSGTFFAEFTIG